MEPGAISSSFLFSTASGRFLMNSSSEWIRSISCCSLPSRSKNNTLSALTEFGDVDKVSVAILLLFVLLLWSETFVLKDQSNEREFRNENMENREDKWCIDRRCQSALMCSVESSVKKFVVALICSVKREKRTTHPHWPRDLRKIANNSITRIKQHQAGTQTEDLSKFYGAQWSQFSTGRFQEG